MEEKKKSIVNVKIITQASIEVEGESDNKILEKFIGDVNSYTIVTNSHLDLKTIDGKVHTFDAHDVGIEYVGIDDVLEDVVKKEKYRPTLSASKELKR